MSLSDHDRPLLPVGEKKTKRIVAYLKSKGIVPDLMLSSSAKRAYETARIIAQGLGYPEEDIRKGPNLYHASSDDILSELYGLDNNIESVMIFGHNPTFTYFVNHYLEDTIFNLPTSGLVGIVFETEKWEKISEAKNHVKFFVTPKMLK
jgi:phosphohistidine phosphatase